MDTPILALTRAQGDAHPNLTPETLAGRNMRLLVQLRWIAVAGQLVTILVVHFGLNITLPLAPMLLIVLALAVANHFARRNLYRRPIGQGAILLALLFDVVALSLQLYLSGGADNPFIAFYLLQLVLGAILLSAPFAAVLVGATVTAYALLIVFGLPLNYPIALLISAPFIEDIGAWISFTLTGALLVIFVTRVIRNLRARDAYLAQARQTAVEEEGFIRLGLLASGAAHELGTPLSSLSVILNDWSRMPQLTADPELFLDLQEMRNDVVRLKTTVGDILHSVGAPRGEDLGRTRIEPYVQGLVDGWMATHPEVQVTLDCHNVAQVALVTEPAMRQVLLSLLDNAVEASSQSIAVKIWRSPQGLHIAIADQGRGFSEDQLATLGKPIRSTKGDGRGLGLFLAAALTRRLGGRLRAFNRAEGGATVELVLPVAALGVCDPDVETQHAAAAVVRTEPAP